MSMNRVSGVTLTILTESPIALSNDQGAGNYSPIKKYFYKDGIHSMTSVGTFTYELRKKLIKEYGWTASGIVIKNKNLYPKKENIEDTDLNGIENDVFGFLVPDKQINKTSPLRVIPFISVNTFKSDTQTVTNRGFLNPDLGREYFDDKGNSISIDEVPTTQALAFEEVFGDYYYYTVTIELDRIGVVEVDDDKYLEPGNRKYMSKKIRKKIIADLIDAILNFTRDIKHQKIHLKPLAVFGGAFKSPIPYFWNDVCIDSKGNLVMDYVCETIKGYGINSENYIVAVSSRIPVTYKDRDFENSIVIDKIPQEAVKKLVSRLDIDNDNYWYLNMEEQK
ncbi:type I-B CRISPR-associated protein Cas7/Cst2/DevR [Acetivibrio clariflavus]|uniref:type I-B CRISPR-associated protein Cas7/Cst2/DevR n=1 Tax=Acetivibrio clariflavus TaxID=288965 RepID=UPI0004842A64|nr:type I-B CRISPR-associated protein Cas7/Cst2/DevR [Acetivibrio clariflavus]HOQ01457.1 type I-B CRISPR-associated protein Cas7/Cst2/DevR [Acetivibrio clariflavus]